MIQHRGFMYKWRLWGSKCNQKNATDNLQFLKVVSKAGVGKRCGCWATLGAGADGWSVATSLVKNSNQCLWSPIAFSSLLKCILKHWFHDLKFHIQFQFYPSETVKATTKWKEIKSLLATLNTLCLPASPFVCCGLAQSMEMMFNHVLFDWSRALRSLPPFQDGVRWLLPVACLDVQTVSARRDTKLCQPWDCVKWPCCCLPWICAKWNCVSLFK